MSSRRVRFTLPAVIQEIEHVLNEYPEYPYQSAFAIPELRLKLIDHILSHVPNRYIIAGEPDRVHMELLVRASILHTLRENADWLSHYLKASLGDQAGQLVRERVGNG